MIDSTQYETDTLATIIMATDKQRARSVLFKLNNGMFAGKMHKNVYTAVRELTEENELVDLTSVSERVSSNSDTGYNNLIFIADMIGDSACHEGSLVHYAKRVRQAYYLRDAQARVNQANQMITELGDLTKVGDLASNISDIFNGLMLETNDQVPVRFQDVAKDYVNKLEKKLAGEESEQVVLTHMHSLDKLTGGFNTTDLILIGGCPGSGKSELTVKLIRGVVKSGFGALMFSLEMSNHQLVERAISGEAGLPVSKLRNPADLGNDGFGLVRQGIKELQHSKFYMTDQAGLTVEQIIETAARHKQNHPDLKLIAVDYAGLLELPKGDRHDIALGTVSRKLKQLAKDIETPVVLLTQLNSKNIDSRMINDRRPRASDIKDSSRLEDDADLILLCYRHKTHDEKAPDVAEIILAKARHAIKGSICYQRFINGHFIETQQDLAKNEIEAFMAPVSSRGQEKNF